MKKMTNQSSEMHGVFPCPVYVVKRDSYYHPKEEKEIGDIVKEGIHWNTGNYTSNDSYIFDTKLKQLKQFCEQQIKIYAEKVIVPKEELDFYITQSWLNITKPGGFHHQHSHANSLISGVFYISTEGNDKITFTDPNYKIKERISFELKKFNIWNSTNCFFPVDNNKLVLFPSWLDHQVEQNEEATTDRISISFNTFVRGTLGNRKDLTELILK